MSLFRRLSDSGLTSDAAYLFGLAAALLSLVLWGMPAGRRRGNVERRAIYAALWAPTLLLLGRGLEDAERSKTIVG